MVKNTNMNNKSLLKYIRSRKPARKEAGLFCNGGVKELLKEIGREAASVRWGLIKTGIQHHKMWQWRPA